MGGFYVAMNGGMDMDYNLTFEIIGTVAFAVSGALVGISKKMDIFGIIVLGIATAIGGGIIRDIIVNITPPNTLQNGLYLFLAIITTVVVFLVYQYRLSRKIPIRFMRPTYLLADNLGLASFTVTGATVGYVTHPDNGILVVILGLLTAIGGGIIRDILAHRIPSVLIEDVYALPSLVGGIVYYFIAIHYNISLASSICFGVVFVIRLVSLYNNWSLPRLKLEDKEKEN